MDYGRGLCIAEEAVAVTIDQHLGRIPEAYETQLSCVGGSAHFTSLQS